MSISSSSFGRKYYLFLLVFLGALSAFGPFITDFYLPTLPSMTSVFQTTPTAVQLGLTTSLIGLAIGQMLFGPVSDKYGRRPVLVFSLLLFTVSAIASIYSPSIEFFNICRFFQGLGGAGGLVMSRSVATDCYTGRELAKTLAIVGAINGIAPIVAPIIGGVVAGFIGWQGIFWVLTAIGVFLLLMCRPFRESLADENRFKGSLWKVASNFFELLKRRYFCIYVLMFGFSYGVLFSYISSASFIVQDHFGHSELFFSVVFAVNATGSAIGSALTMKFKKMKNAALFSTAGMTLCGAGLIATTVLFDSFWWYESITFILLCSLGFIYPSATALTMEEGRMAIGAASALCGAIAYVFGGFVSPLVGIGDVLMTSSVIVFISAVCALGFALVSFRRRDTRAVVE